MHTLHFSALPSAAALDSCSVTRRGALALLRVPVDREEIFFSLALVRNRRIGMGMEEDSTREHVFLLQRPESAKSMPDGVL